VLGPRACAHVRRACFSASLRQDGGKFKLSRKAVLVADGEEPPEGPATPRGGRAPSDAPPSAPPPEVGQVYRGCRITQMLPYGVLVEVAPRRVGLLRVAEWSDAYTTDIADVAAVGDLVDVKVLEVGGDGKFKLSRKAAAAEAALEA
jgi:hypothetical protein